MQELWVLRFARRLMLIDIQMKFREDILNAFRVIQLTRFFFFFFFLFFFLFFFVTDKVSREIIQKG